MTFPLSKKILKIALIAILVVSFSAILIQPAFAAPVTSASGIAGTLLSGAGDTIVGWANSAIQEAFYGVVWIIAQIAGSVFVLAGVLISFTLSLNNQVINMPIVRNGWALTRDFANLGFVLGILVISFSTIIRREEYGMRRLLTKFIVMALMINFSLVIAGAILDFAGVTTAFFANKGLATDQGWWEFSNKLAGLTQVDALLEVGADSGDAFAKTTGDLTVKIASVVFIAIFTVLSAIVFCGITIMFFTRFFYLAFLLIMAPLAWFSGIFPAINQSGKWWNMFLRWTFFAPICMFFLYMSIFTLDQDFNKTTALDQEAIAESTAQVDKIFSEDSPFNMTVGQIGKMIMVLGFLVGSLIAGQKFGIHGASMSMGWAKSAQNWATSRTKRTAGRIAGNAANRGAAAVGSRATGLFNIKKMQEDVAAGKAGTLKRIATRSLQAVQGSSTKGMVSKQKEQYKKYDDNQLINRYRSTTDPNQKAAIIELLADKGKLNKLTLTAKDKNSYKRVGGDMDKIVSVSPLLNDDAKKGKDVSGSLQKLNTAQNDTDKANAQDGFKTSLKKTFSDMKEKDLEKVDTFNVFEKGANSGMNEKDWDDKAKSSAYEVLAKLAPKDFSSLTKKLTPKERTIIGNKTILTLAGLKFKDFEDQMEDKDLVKNTKITETEKIIKGKNESLYNYIKKSFQGPGFGSDEDSKEKKEEKKDDNPNNTMENSINLN